MSKYSLAGKALKLDSGEDAEKYAKEINELKLQPKEIDLSGNTFGVEASKVLSQAIEDQKELEILNLADCFTGRLREEIPAALDHLLKAALTCPNLHTVNLSDNALGLAAIDPLEAFLCKHAPLQHLILTNNGLGPFAGARVGNALSQLGKLKKDKGLEQERPLLTVVCGRNRLENGAMEKFAEFLQSHKTIKEIRLYQNGIRQEGIQQLLTEGLVYNKHLQVLDLQDNTFTEMGARALSTVLPTWENLQVLGISDCLIGNKGGRILTTKIMELSHDGKLSGLRVLSLQYNEIDRKGLKFIHDALTRKSLINDDSKRLTSSQEDEAIRNEQVFIKDGALLKKLEKLELNGNCFSDEDEIINKIREIFQTRGIGQLDQLDDMEWDSSDDDEEEFDKEEEQEDQQDRLLQESTAQEQDIEVAPEDSKDVDQLADLLDKKIDL